MDYYLRQESNEDRHIRLNLEAMSLSVDSIKNAIDLAKNFLPDILSRLTNISTSIDDYLSHTNLTASRLYSEKPVLVKASSELSFLTFGDRYVTVPENFNGNLLEYGETLAACIKDVIPMQRDILSAYNRSLSVFISNKEDRVGIMSHDEIYRKAAAKREAVNKLLSKYFIEYGGRSKLEIKKVLRKLGEVGPIIDTVKVINEDSKPSVVHSMNDNLKECTAKLDIIIKRARENVFDTITPERLRALSEGALEVGKFCEMVSLLYYQAMTYCTTAEMLADHIKACKN